MNLKISQNQPRLHLCIVGLLCSLFIAACEGDSSPFEEAAEVQSLELTSVGITRPRVETFDELVIAVDQSLQLGISAESASAANIVLSASGRRWESDNPSVLSVDENGMLTGSAVGETTVRVSVGGIDADPITVRVSAASLQSIESIRSVESLQVVEFLEQCLPVEFYAIGMFDDNTLRPLYDAVFDGIPNSEELVTNTDAGTATVNAASTDAVTLSASLDGVDPFELQLTVADTLNSIAVTPARAVIEVADIVDLTATGTYDTAVGATSTRPEDISSSVQWEIISGADNASVATDGDNIGRVTGQDEGTAVVRASCGALAAQPDVVITVSNDTGDGSDELSFDPSSLTLSIGDNDVQLEVSQGEDFDEDGTITDDINFSVSESNVSDGSNLQSPIDLSLIQSGLVRALAAGSATVIAILPDDNGGVEASGEITIRVSGS